MNARESGKTTAHLLEFIAHGKAGKAVAYVTPEGSFLSPAAVDKKLAAQNKKLAKELEKIRADLHSGKDVYAQIVKFIKKLEI